MDAPAESQFDAADVADTSATNASTDTSTPAWVVTMWTLAGAAVLVLSVLGASDAAAFGIRWRLPTLCSMRE